MSVELITLYKPDGRPVKVNERSLDAAIKLGWLEKYPNAKVDSKLNKSKQSKK